MFTIKITKQKPNIQGKKIVDYSIRQVQRLQNEAKTGEVNAQVNDRASLVLVE